MLSQEVLDSNSYVVQLRQDADSVWSTAKVSLNRQSNDPITTDEAIKFAEARIGGAKVRVSVEAYDVDTCRMVVSATKLGVANGELADQVMQGILNDIEN